MEIITANSNPKIKNINKLNKNAAFRKEEQVFIVEGSRMFRELPVDRVKQVFVSETAYRKYEAELSVKGITEQDGRLVVVSDSVFQSMSQTKTPQGLLAVVDRYHYTMDDLISVMDKHEGGNTFLVLESIQDPGNLGTIIRLADWFGIEHIFCSPNTVDVYNPKTVQATMGGIARVKLHYTSLPELIGSLKDIPVYGTFLDGANMYTQPLSAHGLIVMGNEGNGIGNEVEQLINRKLYIPNYPSERETSESLNVAIATAVVCAEFRRQAALL